MKMTRRAIRTIWTLRPSRVGERDGCYECGALPARVVVRDTRLCGVCWHRAMVYQAVRRLLT